MTNNKPTDPRVSQALGLITNVGSLLARAETILKSVPVRDIPRLDVMLRGLAQANHNVATAFNAALADVKPTAPAPFVPPTPYKPNLQVDEGRARVEARARAEGRELQNVLGEGPLEWRTR